MKHINIREALLTIDKNTDCQYDLTSLYEACKLNDEDKKQLVKYIDGVADPEVINGFLATKCDAISEELDDDDVSDMKGIIDDINCGEDHSIWKLMDKFEDEDKKLNEETSEEPVKENYKVYTDTNGIMGEPNATYTEQELKAYWDAEKDNDPSLSNYEGDYNAWLNDTVNQMECDELEESALGAAAMALGTAAATGFGQAVGDKVASKVMGEAVPEEEEGTALEEDMDPHYGQLCKQMDADNEILYNEYKKGDKSPADILKGLGYEEVEDHYLIKKEDHDGLEYEMIFDFSDFDMMISDYFEYYVLRDGCIPKGWTSTKTSLEECLKTAINESWWERDWYKDWDQEDIDLHKATDWKARNYEELPVEGTEFTHDVDFYDDDGHKVIKDVEFIKYLRPNGIYAPYYGPKDKSVIPGVGTMYDGHKHTDGIDIHDRTESQGVYDTLSEEKLIKEGKDDIDTVLNRLGGVDKVKAKIEDTRRAYPGIEDDELVDMLWNEGEREEWQSAVEYLSEATATAERPLSALGGTLSSVLLAHKDEVDTLFTAKDAVEFLDRIRPEVKNVGYVDKVKMDIMRKRGILPVQYFYNIILKGDGQGTDKGGVVSKKSQIKKWAAQPATEAVEDDDKPYTYRQVFDELKLETKNFTVEEGAGKYGYESEANHAVKILEKHYASVELDTVGSWFQVDFKDRLKDNKVTEAVEYVKWVQLPDGKWKMWGSNPGPELDPNFLDRAREQNNIDYKDAKVSKNGEYPEGVDESKAIKEEWNTEWDNIGIEIEKAARAQHIGVDFINTDSSVMGAFTATFEINRGDWKHDHWAFDEVVKEYLANNEKYALWKIDTNQIGSSDDDSYNAEHIAFIVPKDKMELLNSMRGLFAESVNPADLTDCPECGDTSFDSKRGRCTKCSYREELDEGIFDSKAKLESKYKEAYKNAFGESSITNLYSNITYTLSDKATEANQFKPLDILLQKIDKKPSLLTYPEVRKLIGDEDLKAKLGDFWRASGEKGMVWLAGKLAPQLIKFWKSLRASKTGVFMGESIEEGLFDRFKKKSDDSEDKSSSSEYVIVVTTNNKKATNSGRYCYTNTQPSTDTRKLKDFAEQANEKARQNKSGLVYKVVKYSDGIDLVGDKWSHGSSPKKSPFTFFGLKESKSIKESSYKKGDRVELDNGMTGTVTKDFDWENEDQVAVEIDGIGEMRYPRSETLRSLKESFPRNINLDQVVIQVANLVDDKALGDDWIEVFPTRDASQSAGGEYFIPLELTGPDDVTKKATFRTRNGRVEVAFLNGSEAMCDSAEEIARFIAGEFGVSLVESIEESYSYSEFEMVFQNYDGLYSPDTHEDIYNEIADKYGEDMANDVLAALEDEYKGNINESGLTIDEQLPLKDLIDKLDAEEEVLDAEVHAYSEDELRKMDAFDNLNATELKEGRMTDRYRAQVKQHFEDEIDSTDISHEIAEDGLSFTIVREDGTKLEFNAAEGYTTTKPEELKEEIATHLYLFPELTDEDMNMAKAYGLQYLGKNHGADGSEDNWVIAGGADSLRRFAEKWLGYELHPDYLYDIDDFAGDIE